MSFDRYDAERRRLRYETDERQETIWVLLSVAVSAACLAAACLLTRYYA